MPPPRIDLDQLLAARQFARVLEASREVVARAPGNGAAWFAMARAALVLGWLPAAHEAIDRALRLGMDGPAQHLVRAVVDHQLGRSAAAVDRLRAMLATNPPNAVDAAISLADILHQTNRLEEFHAFVAAGGAWLDDPRAAVLAARATLRRDRAGCITRLEQLARSGLPAPDRRIAGFEAVRLLDADGEHRRAFDLATHLHATTGAPFDVGSVLADADAQLALLRRGAPWFEARAPRVEGVSIIVGMPRSGTTLLEQMLDRHPAISGIGEYGGVAGLGRTLVSHGLWPRDLSLLSPRAAAEAQREYLAGAALTKRAGTSWTFDKGLQAWHWLPAVAALLPGAACIRIERDPRDAAISLYLSNFHPQNAGWTRSLADIRQVIARERELAPLALRTLGIPHEEVRYEAIVDRPREHLERVLRLLRLPWDEAVLAPEANARTVLTLSKEQVRRPVNRDSIGRWRNYAFAFERGWE